MKSAYQIPMIGAVCTREFADPRVDDRYPLVYVSGASMRQRFVVQILDDGLEGLDVHENDYLVFADSGWPTIEQTVCFICQGDEAIVRILHGVYDTEPLLTTTGERYRDLELHRNQYQVRGQLIGVIRRREARFVEPEEERFDWGC